MSWLMCMSCGRKYDSETEQYKCPHENINERKNDK